MPEEKYVCIFDFGVNWRSKETENITIKELGIRDFFLMY